MGFREGKCPKCHQIIQVPADRETILCMYCGEEINIENAIAAFEDHSALTSSNVSSDDLYMEVRDDFIQMIERIEDPMKNFKKNTYEDLFKGYYNNNLYIIEAIEKAYCVTTDKEQFMNRVTDDMVSRAVENLAQVTKKNKAEERLMQYNMALVLYIMPAFVEYKGMSSQMFTSMLVEKWNGNFDKTNIKPSSFELINGGFRRRWCYITTAVCESLNKPDDCYELTLLRSYRDEYLMQSEEGEKIVQEYYNIAPTIVKHIGRADNAQEIYKNIYDRYLSSCIQLIEADQMEECRSLYSDMVKDLKAQYFIMNKGKEA